MTLKWSSATDQLYAVSNSSPSLDLDFASNKSLLDNISGFPLVNHQRDASSGKSAGTYVGSDGLIKTSVVNLFRYSEDLTQWTTPTNATLASISSSPSGGTAYRLTSTTSSTYSRIFAPSYSGSGDTITASVYLRADVPFVASLRVRKDSGSIVENVNVTTDWQRFQLSSVGIFTSFSDFSIHLNADGISGTSVTGRALDVWGAQLEEGSTASTYIPTTTVASGAPRFDHDPVTGESLGLLIEEGRTNLAKYSEPDDRSTPGVSGEWRFAGLDPNTEIAKVEGPDGVSNSASEMQLATGSGWDAYLHHVPVTSGAFYTFSAWVKLGTATNLALHVNNLANWDTVPDGTYSFDVNDGLNTNTFVKVSHTFTAPSNGSVNVHIGRHGGTAPVQQTQGTVTVWGCQLELGAFSSSTIITSGSTVTRAADVADITGTNFSSWYNVSAPQTWFIDYDTPYAANNLGLVEPNRFVGPFSNGTDSNYH